MSDDLKTVIEQIGDVLTKDKEARLVLSEIIHNQLEQSELRIERKLNTLFDKKLKLMDDQVNRMHNAIVGDPGASIPGYGERIARCENSLVALQDFKLYLLGGAAVIAFIVSLLGAIVVSIVSQQIIN